MAKFELRFFGKVNKKDFIKAECVDNEIIITLKENQFYRDITIDKSTAIKFAKTLRTEINKITELEGGQNGNR